MRLFSLLLLCTIALWSCKVKDVDLENIDPAAEVNLGLALPVGTISATIGDFLGDSAISNLIQVREDGVLFFCDTFDFIKAYSKYNLTEHISNVANTFYLKDHSIPAGISIPRDGHEQTLSFDMTMKLNDINEQFSEARIDKVIVKDAKFVSTISVADFGLRKDEITSVKLVLGDAFICSGGNEIDIPFQNYDFNTEIPINLSEFTLNLMKDQNAEPSNTNILNQLDFTLKVAIKPNNGSAIDVTANSAIQYSLSLAFLDYHAIYGIFNPSNQMHDADTVDITEAWSAWNSIKGLKLQLAEPEIRLHVLHQMSIPLTLYGDFLFTEDAEGNQEFATFDGKQNLVWELENTLPIDAPFTDYCENIFTFNHESKNGEINRLFKLRPDILGYKFNIVPDFTKQKQARISNNIDITLHAETIIPFIFDPGVEIGYSDTISDIDISQLSLDSLLADVNFIDSLKTTDLKLYITATNWLPFDIDAKFRFLDESMNEIALTLAEGNKLHIAGPTLVENREIKEPGKSALLISIDKENFEKLTTVKNIIYDASLGKNTATVKLLDTSRLKLQIGLAADVDAILNLQSKEEGGEK